MLLNYNKIQFLIHTNYNTFTDTVYRKTFLDADIDTINTSSFLPIELIGYLLFLSLSTLFSIYYFNFYWRSKTFSYSCTYIS